MNVLLDTHAFLWWVIDDSQLSDTAKAVIADPINTIYFSVVSAWEIIIKERTGKLSLPEPPETYIPSRLASNRLGTLTVEMQHVLKIASLPDHHRDPFVRLLIAQSQIENIPLLTVPITDRRTTRVAHNSCLA
jgi:PIN domain nuclease of toxin-antitoxin system